MLRTVSEVETETALVAVGLGSLVVLLVLVMWLSDPYRSRRGVGGSDQDFEAQADVEESDIAQMLEARNERRRRLGKPEIGDDLVAELRRDLDRHEA